MSVYVVEGESGFGLCQNEVLAVFSKEDDANTYAKNFNKHNFPYISFATIRVTEFPLLEEVTV